ncbi:MAG TPA: hypothetical protein VD905_03635 [Flavobacteriales bacterium]|nr:hypothetical protein [Flavobacteriales bacterium]
MKFKAIFLIFGLLTGFAGTTFAQANETNLVDSFYASGKIKVVIAGLGIVLAILIFYLVRLDRKLGKLEKEHGIDKKVIKDK